MAKNQTIDLCISNGIAPHSCFDPDSIPLAMQSLISRRRGHRATARISHKKHINAAIHRLPTSHLRNHFKTPVEPCYAWVERLSYGAFS